MTLTELKRRVDEATGPVGEVKIVFTLPNTERLAGLVLTCLGVFSAAVLIAFAGDLMGWRPTDATDSPTHRSGLRLHTDHGTGCQYLATSGGGVTPRMSNGHQMGCAALSASDKTKE